MTRAAIADNGRRCADDLRDDLLRHTHPRSRRSSEAPSNHNCLKVGMGAKTDVDIIHMFATFMPPLPLRPH